MKKILILALLCPVFFIEAQQLDESFLDSLPDDVREDLIERADNQEKMLMKITELLNSLASLNKLKS